MKCTLGSSILAPNVSIGSNAPPAVAALPPSQRHAYSGRTYTTVELAGENFDAIKIHVESNPTSTSSDTNAPIHNVPLRMTVNNGASGPPPMADTMRFGQSTYTASGTTGWSSISISATITIDTVRSLITTAILSYHDENYARSSPLTGSPSSSSSSGISYSMRNIPYTMLSDGTIVTVADGDAARAAYVSGKASSGTLRTDRTSGSFASSSETGYVAPSTGGAPSIRLTIR